MALERAAMFGAMKLASVAMGACLLVAAPAALADEPAPSTPAASPAAAPDGASQPVVPTPSGRTPEQILAEFDGLVIPTAPDGKFETEEFARFQEKRKLVVSRITDLGLELYGVDAKHERTGEVLARRWQLMVSDADARKPDVVIRETSAIAAENKSDAVVAEAMYWNAIATGQQTKFEKGATLASVNRFIDRNPKDERGASMMMFLVSRWAEKDAETAATLLRRIIKDYPETDAARQATGMLKIVDGLNKPFELKFKDVVTGEEIDFQKKFKGKVVVVDFWATWCRPCVAEMPKLKDLYTKFNSRGLEIVGISLDNTPEQGGKDKLLKFIKDNGLSWYQYYQGGGWESEFSKSWGVSSIPRVFIVDADGKLFNTNARGKLEELAEYLLNKRDGKAEGAEPAKP